jgi:hypothetical protein
VVATRKVKSASSTTAIVRLFVSDDVRQEVGGKLTLTGLYTDNVVVIGQLPPDAYGADGELLALGLDSLCFVISIGGLAGKHRAVFRLPGALEEKVQRVDKDVNFEDGKKTANVIFRFRPYIARAPGITAVCIEIGGERYELPYELRATARPEKPVAKRPRRKPVEK